MSDALDASTVLMTLEQSPLGVIIFNNDRIQWINDRLADALRCTKIDLIDKTEAMLSDRRFAPLFSYSNRLTMKLPNGQTQWFERTTKQFHNETMCVHYFQEITGRVELEQRCRSLQSQILALATTDPLTGLMNDRAILAALEVQVSRSRRYYNPLSLLRFSIESTNDPEHLDETLRGIGPGIKDKIRWSDQVGTLEKTTFLIILPETSLSDARHLAKQLVTNRNPLPEESLKCTITLGAAAWQRGDDPDKLSQRLQDDRQFCITPAVAEL